MTKLEGFSMMTTGIRITVLCFLIITLYTSAWGSHEPEKSIAERITSNPKILLSLIIFLLATSTVELLLDVMSHL